MPSQPIPGFVLSAGLIALIVSLLATPLARALAVRRGLYDQPDGGLKPHQRPVPYLGGVAMFLGWTCGLAFLASRGRCTPALAGTVLLVGMILTLTGLIDDVRRLRARYRLLAQAVMAGLLVFAGLGRRAVVGFLTPIADVPAPGQEPWWVLAASSLLCMFILAGATNATNLIDGMDGLCAGVIAIAALGLLLLGGTVGGETAGPGALRQTVSAVLLGVCAAFLFYNFNPASVFMGNSGSYLLGYNVAILLILFAEEASPRWFAGAAIVFGLPVMDTALAIARRWLNGRPLFRGDRSHFYDQLNDRGYSVRQTVIICYGLSVLFAALGLVVVHLPTVFLWLTLVVIPLLAARILSRLGMLRMDDALRRAAPKSG